MKLPVKMAMRSASRALVSGVGVFLAERALKRNGTERRDNARPE